MNLTASTSLWVTIRTPSLFTSRSSTINVPLWVLPIFHNPNYLKKKKKKFKKKKLYKVEERERESYRNLEKEISSGGGRESLRLGIKPPFFISISAFAFFYFQLLWCRAKQSRRRRVRVCEMSLFIMWESSERIN